MKVWVVLFWVVVSTVGYWSFNTVNADQTIEKVAYSYETVLICQSTSATVYHKYQCSGLKRCTHKIVSVDKADAIKFGRRACKICYK